MNKKTFSTVALATLLLTACQNDEETMQTDARGPASDQRHPDPRL